MTPWARRAFNLLALVVSASGVAYAWMAYVLTTDDPFAVVNHPWQPWVLAVHVFVAPWWLVAFGVLLHAHIVPKIVGRTRENRWSGYLALAAFAGMTVSGYGLQVVTAPFLRRAMLVLHLATGGLFLVAYGTHLVLAWRAAVAERSATPRETLAPVACAPVDPPPRRPS